MDQSMMEFFTTNTAIYVSGIIAAVLVGLGLIFEVVWHLCMRRKNDDLDLNLKNSREGVINNGMSSLGNGEYSHEIGRLELKLETLKNELRWVKANMEYTNETLDYIKDCVRK